MSAIRSKNMKPEMVVRKLIHGMGYRYRLHKKSLPGKPDIVSAPVRPLSLFMGVSGISMTVRMAIGQNRIPAIGTHRCTATYRLSIDRCTATYVF